MQHKKSILAYSLIAGSLLATAGVSVNAASIFSFDNLGNGQTVRNNLSATQNMEKDLELKCGEKTKKKDTTKKSDTTKTEKAKKGQEHKCGKDGKCGEGKCGG